VQRQVSDSAKQSMRSDAILTRLAVLEKHDAERAFRYAQQREPSPQRAAKPSPIRLVSRAGDHTAPRLLPVFCVDRRSLCASRICKVTCGAPSGFTMPIPHCTGSQELSNQRYIAESAPAVASDSDSDQDFDPFDRTGGGIPTASWNDRLGRIARLEQCMNDVRAELAGAMTPRTSNHFI
jgi:hypothetical protein